MVSDEDRSPREIDSDIDISAGLIPKAANHDLDPRKMNQRIDAAVEGERWEEARLMIEQELAKMPKDWKPEWQEGGWLVRAFWSLDEFRAFVGYRTGTEDMPSIGWAILSYSKLWSRLAAVNRKQGILNNALACVEKGLELEPDHPCLWVEKGTILGKGAQHEQALSAYETAAVIRPWAASSTVAWALRRQGFELVELGRMADAQAVYRRSLEFDPDSKAAKDELDGIDKFLRDQGTPSARMPWFLHALRFPPEDPVTRELLVLVDGMTPLNGPNVVGPDNYRRISKAFRERGWEGFEEEFSRLYPPDRPDSIDIKRDLLREALFLTKVHTRASRIYLGEATVEEVMDEIHRSPDPPKDSPKLH